MNNGAVLVSPLVNGGRTYGAVDRETLLTRGFNRVTGQTEPATLIREGDVYSAVCDALDVEFDGPSGTIPCVSG